MFTNLNVKQIYDEQSLAIKSKLNIFGHIDNMDMQQSKQTHHGHIFKSAPQIKHFQFDLSSNRKDQEDEIFNASYMGQSQYGYFLQQQDHYQEQVSCFNDDADQEKDKQRQNIFQGLKGFEFDNYYQNSFYQDNSGQITQQIERSQCKGQIDNLNQFDFSLDLGMKNTNKLSSSTTNNPHYYTDRVFKQSNGRQKKRKSLQKVKSKGEHLNQYLIDSSYFQNNKKTIIKSKKLKQNVPFSVMLKQSNILAQILPQNSKNNSFYRQKSIISSSKSSNKSIFIDQCSNMTGVQNKQNKQKLFKKIDKLINANDRGGFKKRGLKREAHSQIKEQSSDQDKNKMMSNQILIKNNNQVNRDKKNISSGIKQSSFNNSGIKMFKRSSGSGYSTTQKKIDINFNKNKLRKQQNNQSIIRDSSNTQTESLQRTQQNRIKQQLNKQTQGLRQQQKGFNSTRRQFNYIALSLSLLIQLSHSMKSQVYEAFLQLNRLYHFSLNQIQINQWQKNINERSSKIKQQQRILNQKWAHIRDIRQQLTGQINGQLNQINGNIKVQKVNQIISSTNLPANLLQASFNPLYKKRIQLQNEFNIFDQF